MRKIRKKLKTPLRPWDKNRIEEERKILQKYGLRRKREIWKTESVLRNYRRRARTIAAKNDKKGEKILLDKLYKMSIIESRDVNLSAVLSLKVGNILDRRLQTIVFQKNFANSILQARQLITHGHIVVEEKRNIFPSFLVPRDAENKIGYYGDFKIEKSKKDESQNEPIEISTEKMNKKNEKVKEIEKPTEKETVKTEEK